MTIAVIAQLARQSETTASAARAQRLEVGDLRSDVDVQADDLDAVERANRRQQLPGGVRSACRIVGLQTGRDVGMALRVDVRVDAKRDAGPGLPSRRQRVDALRSLLRTRH